MMLEEYILRSNFICLVLWAITIIPLIIYIVILRKRLTLFNKKKSILATQDEIKKLFSEEEKDKIVRIKKSGRESAKRFDLVSVLFSDIQGFTKIAEELNPESLIDELDVFFYHFDNMVDKYNIEKIKTIGDAYMCAGGIPKENRTNPIEVVMAAIEMQQFMREMKHKKGEMWDLRIGIHTGSVIAGMVGHKKITYDIWGDTVNTASRMESSCTPGKINISGQTYEFAKEYFICEYRGKMPVKYKGNIDMYYVTGIKPELKTPINGTKLDTFTIKLQLLRIFDLEKYILQQFERYANTDLHYHNVKNTIDLYTHADLFSRAENLPEIDTIIVLTAALVRNLGYLINYETCHEETIVMTKSILPDFKYNNEQIEEVCILLDEVRDETKEPVTLRGRILKDAIFSYIGRVDYEDLVRDMYNEEKKNQYEHADNLRERQIAILENYHYHTKAATALREVSQEIQLEKIKKIKL